MQLRSSWSSVYMGCAKRKHVFWDIHAVWSGPSLSTYRNIGHYRMYQWRANTWSDFTHVWEESECACSKNLISCVAHSFRSLSSFWFSWNRILVNYWLGGMSSFACYPIYPKVFLQVLSWSYLSLKDKQVHFTTTSSDLGLHCFLSSKSMPFSSQTDSKKVIWAGPVIISFIILKGMTLESNEHTPKMKIVEVNFSGPD